MVFSSVTFIFFFLPVTLIGYYLLGKKARNIWLLFASLFFYAWGGLSALPIILVSIIANYFGGYFVDKARVCENYKLEKAIFVLTIALNLLLLGYWKYFNFTLGILDHFIPGITNRFDEVILPIGISFFTFQGMSYVIDVYRDKVPVQKNILKVGLYVALFPQLIAGPIVRYTDINEQIDVREHNLEDFMIGVRRFIVGLAKKVIIANQVGLVADRIFDAPPFENTIIIAWIGAISYMFQIYFDFSGYSDMAIGLGRMFGFHFPENFNYPFISKSITEVWTRWHMTLAQWFRDYVYIPLGGNRVSKWRWIFNTFCVWFLTGLWHGANWTYIAWGLTFFVLIMFEKGTGFPQKLGRFAWIYTDFFFLLGVVIFRADSLTHAWNYIKSMFGILPLHNVGYGWQWYVDRYTAFIYIVAAFASTPILKKIVPKIQEKVGDTWYHLLCNVSAFALLGFSLLHVITDTYNPFIYFQF